MSEIPDIEVARYALRTFNIKNGRLMPVAVPVDAWEGGTCEARCIPVFFGPARNPFTPHHDAPAEGCHCGIYGCLTIERLKRQYPIECMGVVAVIAVEGNTIIGDVGLRTQAARIVAYWSPKRGVRKICADTCGDATGFMSLNDMLTAYGFEPDENWWPLLDPPKPPRPSRVSRILFWAKIVCIAVNIAFFITGLFTSAGTLPQLASLGAAALCTGSVVLTRRNRRKHGAS